MSTISFDMTVMESARFARRVLGDRFYAGLPAQGFVETSMLVVPGAQVLLPPAPSNVVVVLVSADVNEFLAVGWTGAGGTVELPVRQMCMFTPPPDVTSTLYLRSTAVTGSPVATCRAVIVY